MKTNLKADFWLDIRALWLYGVVILSVILSLIFRSQLTKFLRIRQSKRQSILSNQISTNTQI